MGRAPVEETPNRDGRLLVFVALGAGLFVVAHVTRHAHALVMAKGYAAGLLLIILYRNLARMPSLRRFVPIHLPPSR